MVHGEVPVANVLPSALSEVLARWGCTTKDLCYAYCMYMCLSFCVGMCGVYVMGKGGPRLRVGSLNPAGIVQAACPPVTCSLTVLSASQVWLPV